MGRSGAGVLGLVIATALVAVGCTSSSSDSSPPPERLPDGFHTVPGARLLGAPVPEIPLSDRGYGTPDPNQRAWTADLTVEDHGRRVYDRLAAQVARHDLPPMESFLTACRTRETWRAAGRPIGNDDLRCEGSSELPDHSRNAWVTVRVCSRCNPKVSAARISYSAATSARGGAKHWTALAPAVPAPGPSPFGRLGDKFPVHADTQVLGRALEGCSPGPGPIVLAVTGDPDLVWADYAAAFEARGRVIGRARAEFDGRQIRQIAIAPTDYSAEVTLIEGRGLEHPVLVYESCG